MARISSATCCHPEPVVVHGYSSLAGTRVVLHAHQTPSARYLAWMASINGPNGFSFGAHVSSAGPSARMCLGMLGWWSICVVLASCSLLQLNVDLDVDRQSRRLPTSSSGGGGEVRHCRRGDIDQGETLTAAQQEVAIARLAIDAGGRRRGRCSRGAGICRRCRCRRRCLSSSRFPAPLSCLRLCSRAW